jgi:hypothetical protein
MYVFYCKVTKILKDICGARGDVVIKALRRKPAGRGIDSRLCHWNFSVTGRTMALGLTQPQTEMSVWCIS